MKGRHLKEFVNARVDDDWNIDKVQILMDSLAYGRIIINLEGGLNEDMEQEREYRAVRGGGLAPAPDNVFPEPHWEVRPGRAQEPRTRVYAAEGGTAAAR